MSHSIFRPLMVLLHVGSSIERLFPSMLFCRCSGCPVSKDNPRATPPLFQGGDLGVRKKKVVEQDLHNWLSSRIYGSDLKNLSWVFSSVVHVWSNVKGNKHSLLALLEPLRQLNILGPYHKSLSVYLGLHPFSFLWLWRLFKTKPVPAAGHMVSCLFLCFSSCGELWLE